MPNKPTVVKMTNRDFRSLFAYFMLCVYCKDGYKERASKASSRELGAENAAFMRYEKWRKKSYEQAMALLPPYIHKLMASDTIITRVNSAEMFGSNPVENPGKYAPSKSALLECSKDGKTTYHVVKLGLLRLTITTWYLSDNVFPDIVFAVTSVRRDICNKEYHETVENAEDENDYDKKSLLEGVLSVNDTRAILMSQDYSGPRNTLFAIFTGMQSITSLIRIVAKRMAARKVPAK